MTYLIKVLNSVIRVQNSENSQIVKFHQRRDKWRRLATCNHQSRCVEARINSYQLNGVMKTRAPIHLYLFYFSPYMVLVGLWTLQGVSVRSNTPSERNTPHTDLCWILIYLFINYQCLQHALYLQLYPVDIIIHYPPVNPMMSHLTLVATWLESVNILNTIFTT